MWLLGTLFAGFMAGIGTYKAILEIAQLEVVSRAKLETLEDDLDPSIEGPSSAPSNLVNDRSPNRLQSQPSSFGISDSPPYPEGLDSVKPGMTLSVARSVFPGGEMRSGNYSVSLDSDVFSTLAFSTDGRGPDPRIEAVHLFLSEEYSVSNFLATLLRELADWPHRTEMLGERLVWPNVNGYQLRFEDGMYTISAAAAATD